MTPDEGPLLTTPRRLADELHAIAIAWARLQLRLRTLAIHLGVEPLRELHDALWQGAALTTDLAAKVRVGAVPILYRDDTPPDPLPLFKEPADGLPRIDATPAGMVGGPDRDPPIGGGAGGLLAADHQGPELGIVPAGGCTALLDTTRWAPTPKRSRRGKRAARPAVAQDPEAPNLAAGDAADAPGAGAEDAPAAEAAGVIDRPGGGARDLRRRGHR